MKEKRRTCKGCKEKYTPVYYNQIVCSFKCSVTYAKEQRLKKQNKIIKDWNKEKKKRKEELEPLSFFINKLQKYFNKYVRLRDNKKPCISCNRSNKGVKVNAGHLYNVGDYPEVRFNEINVNLQCEHCNNFKRGNVIEYRKNLIKRIGEENVLELEALLHKPANYMKHEVIELIEVYKKKIKEEEERIKLENERNK